MKRLDIKLMDEFWSALEESDIAFTSTSATNCIVTKDELNAGVWAEYTDRFGFKNYLKTQKRVVNDNTRTSTNIERHRLHHNVFLNQGCQLRRWSADFDEAVEDLRETLPLGSESPGEKIYVHLNSPSAQDLQ